MKIGSPGVGSKGSKRAYFSLKKDTTLVVRILPPLGDLAEKGIWSVYHQVHYGYKNSQGYMRPFLSCREVNRQTKMVEVEDPAFLRIQKLNETREMIAKDLASAAPNSVKAKKLGEKLEQVKDLLQRYNLAKQHHMNALSLDGAIGVLKLKHKEKLALDAFRKEIMRDENIDPVAAENGIFVQLSKSGQGRDSVVQVKAHIETSKDESGRVSRDYRYHTVDPNDKAFVARLSSEAAELDKLYKQVTPEQIALMVEKGEAGVDMVFPPNDKGPSSASSSGSNSNSSSSEDGADDDLSKYDDLDKIDLSSGSSNKKEATGEIEEDLDLGAIEEEGEDNIDTTEQASDDDFLKSLGLD